MKMEWKKYVHNRFIWKDRFPVEKMFQNEPEYAENRAES